MPATEILSVQAIAGSRPESLLSAMDNIATVNDVYWGYVIGEPKTFRAFLDWDSVEAHQAFARTDGYATFIKDVQACVAGPPSMFHVTFLPSTEAQHKAQQAPVTEAVTFYFSGAPPQGFVETALGFRQVLSQQPGFVELAVGTTIEAVDHNDTKGNAVVALIGWKTREDFETFRDSETYKSQNPGLSLKDGELIGLDMIVANLHPT